MIELCDMGAAEIDSEDGVLLVQCKGASVGGDDANPDFGQVPFACSLGLTAMPYPADSSGSAEGLVASDVLGTDGVLIGARDTRTAKIVKNLKPGDTVVHSTGPQQAAQLQLKEEKRQVVLATKDTRGKDMALILDGKNDKVTLAVFGHVLEFTRETIRLQHRSGPSINLSAALIAAIGKTVIGGSTPVAPLAGCVPPAVPPGPATAGVATAGAWYGA